MTGGGVRGFLFADLRGYTRFVEAHGDAAAAELLTDYRELVRSIIGRHAGAEIRTEGDGVYVVFDSVTDAVDAGLELIAAAAAATAATPDRPIRVAVGIHAGETTATGEGPVGSAVNIAARVCAKAEAGEVLVTETVRALVRTARPYRSTSLGSQHLKGVAEAVALHRLEAAPSSALTRVRRKARARRRTLAVLGLAACVVVLGAGAAWAVNRPPDCVTLPASTKDVVVRIDPDRGCVVQVVKVGIRPGPMVATDSTLWVADRGGWTITRIDLATRTVIDWLGLPGSPISLAADPSGEVDVLTFDDRSVDIGSNTLRHRLVFLDRGAGDVSLIRLLPAEGSTLPGQRPLAQTTYTGLADAGGWTWIVSPRGTVARATHLGLVETDLAVVGASRPSLVEASGGSVWIADEQAATVYRFDGLEERPSSMSLAGPGGTRAMAVTDDGIWLLRANGSLTRLETATGAQRQVHLAGSADDLAIVGETIWLLDSASRTVRSIDTGSGATLASVAVGGLPGGAVVAAGDLWVSISAP